MTISEEEISAVAGIKDKDVIHTLAKMIDVRIFFNGNPLN